MDQKKLDAFAVAFMSSWAGDIKNPNPDRVCEVSYNIAEAMLEESNRRLARAVDSTVVDQDKLDYFATEFMKAWAGDISNPDPGRVSEVSFSIAAAMLEESERRMQKGSASLEKTE